MYGAMEVFLTHVLHSFDVNSYLNSLYHTMGEEWRENAEI